MNTGTCFKCKGSGKYFNIGKCYRCDGRGYILLRDRSIFTNTTMEATESKEIAKK